MLSFSLSTALRSVSRSHPGALLVMNAKKVSSSTAALVRCGCPSGPGKRSKTPRAEEDQDPCDVPGGSEEVP